MPKRKLRPVIRPGLNEQIREVRQTARLTQIELANAIGVTQRFISGLERGEKTPNIHHLIAIAEATGHAFAIDAETVVFSKSG